MNDEKKIPYPEEQVETLVSLIVGDRRDGTRGVQTAYLRAHKALRVFHGLDTADLANPEKVDVESIRSDIAAILNQARCLEKREVGNIELSERIKDYLASRGLLSGVARGDDLETLFDMFPEGFDPLVIRMSQNEWACAVIGPLGMAVCSETAPTLKDALNKAIKSALMRVE